MFVCFEKSSHLVRQQMTNETSQATHVLGFFTSFIQVDADLSSSWLCCCNHLTIYDWISFLTLHHASCLLCHLYVQPRTTEMMLRSHVLHVCRASQIWLALPSRESWSAWNPLDFLQKILLHLISKMMEPLSKPKFQNVCCQKNTTWDLFVVSYFLRNMDPKWILPSIACKLFSLDGYHPSFRQISTEMIIQNLNQKFTKFYEQKTNLRDGHVKLIFAPDRVELLSLESGLTSRWAREARTMRPTLKLAMMNVWVELEHWCWQWMFQSLLSTIANN